MTKEALINRLAKNCGLSRVQSMSAIEEIFSAITESLKENNKFNYTGFGKFDVRKRPAKAARHPKTGKPITIPPRNVIIFSPSPKLLSDLNRKKTR
ncbi:MAG: HU family DNA-binding protein [Chloroflexi bacterium]|nr:HU family DNA-binding protein [Chloroflexota bacterium]